MEEKTRVKIAVIGLGIMGSSHMYELTQLDNTQLVAVCDIDRSRADQAAEDYQVPAYYDYHDLLDKADLDAVIIATPHYFHTPISIDSLDRGIHVLTEKPLAVHVKDGQKMIAAYEKAHQKDPNLVFGIMFQNRTHGFWRVGKELIDQGVLGRLVRATWIITDWFRTQTYYNNGGWRATWKGEGGGVLLNQCPHNLDIYTWFFGLPKRVAGFVPSVNITISRSKMKLPAISNMKTAWSGISSPQQPSRPVLTVLKSSVKTAGWFSKTGV
jgi:predicted dehydrogenase